MPAIPIYEGAQQISDGRWCRSILKEGSAGDDHRGYVSEKQLYLVQSDGEAMRYGIGVGREGFEWRGKRAHRAEARVAGVDAALRQ